MTEGSLHDLSIKPLTVSLSFKVKLMSAVFVFFFLYVGTEVAYGQFIATFSIRHSDFTERRAAMLTSVYWGMFALARGLAVPLSRCMTPSKMLISSIVITLLSAGGLTAVTYLNKSVIFIWTLSGTLGVGMAAIFPTGVLWLEDHIKVTAKMASIFVIASSLGEMVIPALVGFFIDHTGPQVLMLTVLLCSAGCAVVFCLMVFIASVSSNQYQSLRRNEAIPMNTFEFSSDEDTDNEPILRSNGKRHKWAQQT